MCPLPRGQFKIAGLWPWGSTAACTRTKVTWYLIATVKSEPSPDSQSTLGAKDKTLGQELLTLLCPNTGCSLSPWICYHFHFRPEAQSPVQQSHILGCPALLRVWWEQRVHLRDLGLCKPTLCLIACVTLRGFRADTLVMWVFSDISLPLRGGISCKSSMKCDGRRLLAYCSLWKSRCPG